MNLDRTGSKSSILQDDKLAKKNAIFTDPVKEKKSVYDPLKISANYN